MKIYSVWQPLDDEDQRTALVFGFLRHAPPEHGLSPWLTEVLARPTTAAALEPDDFWPEYKSHVPGCTRTVPELVFGANDEDGPLHVAVEVKPGFGMHRNQQLVREVVDTAHGERAIRIALIAIGADLGAPREVPAWRAAADAGLAEHGPTGATATVHYSSWAQLGAHVQAAGTAVPTLAVYSEDVVTQLLYKALLGYKGAPVYDDLDGLNIVNAFEVLNRSASAARRGAHSRETETCGRRA